MSGDILKGVFVFFLGVFIGGASLKYFRPKGLPTEQEILLENKNLKVKMESLRQKFQTVADQEIKSFVVSKNSPAQASQALMAVIPILVEELNVRVESFSRPSIQKEPIEGYERYQQPDPPNQ